LREEGIKAGLLRPVTLFPFPANAINEYSKRIKKVLVVEMNTGQMLRDVQLSCTDDTTVYFYGGPVVAYISDDIMREVKKIM
jgi:2-oxoglutarate ferredoxin oxidoreductase subunit alpha